MKELLVEIEEIFRNEGALLLSELGCKMVSLSYTIQVDGKVNIRFRLDWQGLFISTIAEKNTQ